MRFAHVQSRRGANQRSERSIVDSFIFAESMARFVLLSSRALKSFFGQKIPSQDQTGTPAALLGSFHFTSSTTEGDAFLIEAHI
jgi:hypothetical protein